jgi:hypothetical protein
MQRAGGSMARHIALYGARTAAGMREVEQRMEQLPSRKSGDMRASVTGTQNQAQGFRRSAG